MRIPRKPPEPFEILQRRSNDLNKMFLDSELHLFSREIEAAYYGWDRVRIIARSRGIDPELAWAVIKLARRQRYRELPLRGHDATMAHFLVPDAVQRELMMIDQQLAGQIALSEEGSLEPSQRERFIIRSLHEEAIASSMLEGADTTHRDAKQMLRTKRKPHNRGEQMVVNNYKAIEFIREHRSTGLTTDFLLELQTILTRDTLDRPDQVGRFRTSADDVYVEDRRDGEVVHTPPDASQLESRLRELCEFANQADDAGEKFIHPVIRACVLHYQIGFDHPFCDGNGRTARVVFYWLMLRYGYWLFEYLPISRLIYRGPSKYVKAFLQTETDGYDVTYFLLYKARIIGRARQELRDYMAQRQSQIQQARKVFQNDPRLNHRQREVILQATRNPDRFFSIAWHSGKQGVSYETARSDLLDLAGWGYLSQQKVGRRFEFCAGPRISDLRE